MADKYSGEGIYHGWIDYFGCGFNHNGVHFVIILLTDPRDQSEYQICLKRDGSCPDVLGMPDNCYGWDLVWLKVDGDKLLWIEHMGSFGEPDKRWDAVDKPCLENFREK